MATNNRKKKLTGPAHPAEKQIYRLPERGITLHQSIREIKEERKKPDPPGKISTRNPAEFKAAFSDILKKEIFSTVITIKQETRAKMRQELARQMKAENMDIPESAISGMLEKISAQGISITQEIISPLFVSESWQRLRAAVAAISKTLQDMPGKSPAEDLAELETLTPYLLQELQKPEYDDLPAEDTPQRAQLLERAYTAARAAMLADQEEEKKEKEPGPLTKARESGAVMTINGHLASFSEKELQDALTSNRIFRLPGSTTDFDFDQETGQLDTVSMLNTSLETLDVIHTATLMTIVRFCQISLDQEKGNPGGLLKFYLPAVCRELKLDPRGYSSKRKQLPASAQQSKFADKRVDAFLERIAPFDPLVGRAADGKYYRVLTFHSYDKESQTMTVSAPYIFKQIEILEARGSLKKSLNTLIWSNVINEDPAAVELANRILNGLLQRGTRPDRKTYNKTPEPNKTRETYTIKDKNGTIETRTTIYETPADPAEQEHPETERKLVTYSITFQSLINDCPQLKTALEKIKAGKYEPKRKKKSGAPEPKPGSPEALEAKKKEAEARKKIWRQAYNSKLKQTFETALKIITEKSDAPYYYLNFDYGPKDTITNKIKAPTVSTLKREFYITHTGKNKEFTQLFS